MCCAARSPPFLEGQLVCFVVAGGRKTSLHRNPNPLAKFGMNMCRLESVPRISINFLKRVVQGVTRGRIALNGLSTKEFERPVLNY